MWRIQMGKLLEKLESWVFWVEINLKLFRFVWRLLVNLKWKRYWFLVLEGNRIWKICWICWYFNFVWRFGCKVESKGDNTENSDFWNRYEFARFAGFVVISILHINLAAKLKNKEMFDLEILGERNKLIFLRERKKWLIWKYFYFV